MRTALKGTGVGLSAMTFMMWTGVTAAADNGISVADDTVSAIDAVAGQSLDNAIHVVSADSTVTAGAGVSVDLSSNATDGISIDSPLVGEIEIGLPFAQAADDAEIVDGVLVYDNDNGSTTTPLVLEDGSVQILTTIADISAPIDYAYPLDIPVGAVLSLTPDGGAEVTTSDDVVIVSIAAPWAYDVNGAPVPTRYEVTGTTLSQVVDHGPDTAYPVVADPSISFGWAVYLKYSKSEVRTVTTGLGGAINDKAKFGLILCGKIPHWAAKGGCALVGTTYHTSIYNTFKDAKANGQCVEVQLAYISYLPVVWKKYSC